MSENKSKLKPYLSPAAVWAFSLGTSVGWGSLVVTSNTYLSDAGPLGSVLGMLAGTCIMLVISRNYRYLINCFPDAGGAYAYARESFGYDQGFLIAWFLLLTYLAILWANATSLQLFAGYFLGNVFRFGYLYTLFGYEVYIGEVLMTAAALVLVALLCARAKRAAAFMMTALVAVFVIGIAVCFFAALGRLDVSAEPLMIPETRALSQVIRIACISPWAFIGFESISHSSEEYAFTKTKIGRILTASVLSTVCIYLFVTLLSVTAYPPQYDSWLSYIRDLGSLSGIEALPAFYAAGHYLGRPGLIILILALFALVITSLIGNMTALSRLVYALAEDRLFPSGFAGLNDRGTPVKALALIAAVSLLIPFLGRTAIGWIVDVTTIGATIIYGFVSASAYKTARLCGDGKEAKYGLAGLILMIGFSLYLLVSNLFTTGVMDTAAYILFVIWSILGFIIFRLILQKDDSKRFGRSIVVWIALLSLIVFISLVWLSRSTMEATERTLSRVAEHKLAATTIEEDEAFIEEEMAALRIANGCRLLVVIGLFGVSLGVLVNNYSIMSRRAIRSEAELGNVRNIANTDPLTGVKSKHAYADREKTISEQLETNKAEPFSIVVCDVNGLKAINDTYGHKAGDAYICSAARLICDMYQHSPVYRVGGDEFVVILTGRDHDSRETILKQLNERVEGNIAAGEVVIACGMADFDADRDVTMHDTFMRADALMYERKKQLKSMGAVTR